MSHSVLQAAHIDLIESQMITYFTFILLQTTHQKLLAKPE